MCDNEYLAHQMVKDRLREAETRGTLNAMIREAAILREGRGTEAGRERLQPTWLDICWQAPAAWVAHLALPKIWNRL